MARVVGQGRRHPLSIHGRKGRFRSTCDSFVLAPPPAAAYMWGMNSKTIILIVALVVMLGAAMAFSWHVWTSVGAAASDSGGEAMNGNGMAALIIGGIGTLAVGAGLMALVFYSSRRGYDDAADFKHMDE